jgi:uncharacterized protein
VNEIVSASIARRVLLDAQGLLDDPTRPAARASILRMIQRMGFVQLDSINVVERAHHLMLSARFDAYRAPMLESLLEKKRRLFEHWTHDAAAIPLDLFPHWHHRFARYRVRLRKNKWWRHRIGDDPDPMLDAVRSRIIKEGAMMSKDFEEIAPRRSRTPGWWEWKREKAALEFLWWTGELAVTRRVGFQKVYDLIERVLPDHARAPASDPRAHVDWACRSALERLGFASPNEIAAFWEAVSLEEARAWCTARERSGELEAVTLESADGSKPRAAYALVDSRRKARALHDPPDRMRLLAPFDPILWDRKRARRFFGFDYRFEAFTPSPKRKYGYYVMPILESDRLVGRVDPKLHRERRVLEIKSVHWEPTVRATKPRRRALEAAVERLAAAIGADEARLPPSR